MKIELDHNEIGDAIALWLKSKVINGVTYDVDVSRCDSLPRHGGEGPTKWKITAKATAIHDKTEAQSKVAA